MPDWNFPEVGGHWWNGFTSPQSEPFAQIDVESNLMSMGREFWPICMVPAMCT